MSNEPRTILIVLMGSLGDVVRGLTVADGIRQSLPDTRIFWLVEPKCRGMVDLSASIDTIIEFDRKHPFLGLFRLASELRRHRFDIVLDMQRHFKSGFFSWLTGAPRRIGFHRKDAKEGNWLFQTEYIPREEVPGNKFGLYQRFLTALGIPERKSPILALKPVPTWSEKGRRSAFFVMGSSWESKNWVFEGYRDLAASLLQKGWHLHLVGGAPDAPLASKVAAACQSTAVTNHCGKTSLSGLLSIIKQSDFGVGPDSGPGHIASALGVPYITLFGPTSPERVAPVGAENLVVSASVGCSPCYMRFCPGLNKICMRLISTPLILEKVSICTKENNG